MKAVLRRVGRILFLTVVAALVLLLTGSGDPNRPQPKLRALESTAVLLGSDLPREEQEAWEHAARINPLWLIEASVR